MRSEAVALKRFVDLTSEDVWRHVTASFTEKGTDPHGNRGQSWLPGTFLDRSLRRFSESGGISIGDVYSGASASGRSTYYITVLTFNPNRSFSIRESHWNPLDTHGDDPVTKSYATMDFEVVERDSFVDLKIKRTELIPFRISAISSIASWAAGRLEFIISRNTFGQYGKNDSKVVNGYKIMRS